MTKLFTQPNITHSRSLILNLTFAFIKTLNLALSHTLNLTFELTFTITNALSQKACDISFLNLKLISKMLSHPPAACFGVLHMI